MVDLVPTPTSGSFCVNFWAEQSGRLASEAPRAVSGTPELLSISRVWRNVRVLWPSEKYGECTAPPTA